MFGSRIASREVYRVLSTTSGVTTVVGDRIHKGVGYPQGVTLPALLFYVERADYFGPVTTERAEHINAETVRVRVQLDDSGRSDTRIAPAADAQFAALAGLRIDTADNYQLTFGVSGEALPTTYIDGDTTYQRLGTVYSVEVTRGG